MEVGGLSVWHYESGNLKGFPNIPICNFLSKGPRENDLMEKRQGDDVSSVLFAPINHTK